MNHNAADLTHKHTHTHTSNFWLAMNFIYLGLLPSLATRGPHWLTICVHTLISYLTDWFRPQLSHNTVQWWICNVWAETSVISSLHNHAVMLSAALIISNSCPPSFTSSYQRLISFKTLTGSYPVSIVELPHTRIVLMSYLPDGRRAKFLEASNSSTQNRVWLHPSYMSV